MRGHDWGLPEWITGDPERYDYAVALRRQYEDCMHLRDHASRYVNGSDLRVTVPYSDTGDKKLDKMHDEWHENSCPLLTGVHF